MLGVTMDNTEEPEIIVIVSQKFHPIGLTDGSTYFKILAELPMVANYAILLQL